MQNIVEYAGYKGVSRDIGKSVKSQRHYMYKKTVHRQESGGCGDLFVWFGGPLHNSFPGPVIC